MKIVYEGNVEITKENEKEMAFKLKGVTKITGNVDVSGFATFPLLAEVGGYVDVYGSAKADFPLLAAHTELKSLQGFLRLNKEIRK
jgi:hypothetical protein